MSYKNNKNLTANIKPNKKLGQNFLVDKKIINQICLMIPNLNDFDCILEIGPGKGILTDFLLQFEKPLIAIEYDQRLFDFLKEKYKVESQIKLINQDVLKTDFSKILKQYKKVIVIANIPYYITTPIINKCAAEQKIDAMFLMMQKEVADKFVQKNNKSKTAFSNFINFYFKIFKILFIPSKSFYPIPKVNSQILQFERKNNQKIDKKFYNFLKIVFSTKRKKMLNNVLIESYQNNIINFFKANDISLNIRAEELTTEQLKDLYSFLKQQGSIK